MAIAYDNHTTDAVSVGTDVSRTVNHTISGSSNLAVFVCISLDINPGKAVSGVTYAGNTMTLIQSGHDGAYATRALIYGYLGPASGANDAIVSFNSNNSYGCVITVISFTGVHQTTGWAGATGGGGNSSAPTVNITSASGELVLDTVSGYADVISLTADASQTQRWSNLSGNKGGGGSHEAGSATVTMSWTLGAAVKWAIGGCSIKPAAAGGTAFTYAGGLVSIAVADNATAKTKIYDADTRSHAVVSYDSTRAIVRDGDVRSLGVIAYDSARAIVRDGDTRSIAVSDSTYVPTLIGGTAKTYDGAVVSIAVSDNSTSRGKAYDGDARTEVVVSKDATRGFAYNGDTRSLGIVSKDSVRGFAYSADCGLFAVVGGTYSSTTDLSKVYAGDVSLQSVVDSDHARGRTYDVSDVRSIANVSYAFERCRGYDGVAYTIVLVDSVYSTTGNIVKTYDGVAEAKVLAASVYSSNLAEVLTYVGTAELMSTASSVVTKGKVYVADGRLIAVLDGICRLNPIQYVSTLILTTVAGSVSVFTIGTARNLELLPTRPYAIDGAWTDPAQDGVWDEYPVHGAYTYIGYDAEFKPFHRATITQESVPSRGSATRGAHTETTTRGAWTEPPVWGAYTQDDSYILEVKPK
jgi:hypothetical protein